MIKIDHLSFDFATSDEPFAHHLYADWDNFCHDCFEQVVEECLSGYDKEKVLYEIEQLDLNLGHIPEKDFYQEFPQRLREELLKALPSFYYSAQIQEEKTEFSRFENLFFYLEQGYPKAEWADEDFNLTEELGWVLVHASQYMDKLVKLCMSKEYALCRLLWQTDDEAILLQIYAAALSEHTFGRYEKRRLLGRFLESKPGIPVRFTHQAEGDTVLYGMAELLDSLYIRQIMETEAEEHAEVDLPPYWHYLYEWLIRYYPFNGLAIFGGKGEFTRLLHFRLLTFIRGRNYSYYLSKAELTRSFLLEVFGPAYYIEVLNAIYTLQPHHPDGSPVFDDYFNRELYRILLQLSLLWTPVREEAGEVNLYRRETAFSFLTDAGQEQSVKGFVAWLEDTTVSRKSKRELLLRLAVERPPEWLRLLRKLPADNKLVSLVVSHLSAPLLLQSMERVDFRQASVLSQTVEWIQRKADRFAIFAGKNILLSTALSKALLLYMQDKDTLGGRALTESETIDKFLSYLYLIYSGKSDFRENKEWADLSGTMATDMKTNSRQELQDKWIYNNKEETVHSFVQSLPSQQGKINAEKEKTAKLITIIVNSMNTENYSPSGEEREIPTFFQINNAGFSLLNPFIPRLFSILDYLGADRRSFKDTQSQIRAIFVLQYLFKSEEQEYNETELIFNRLLVGLPMHIPLPKSLQLTDNEKQTCESLLNGVKEAWTKMRNTSIRGLQESFICRTGKLEQQEDRWLLTVDERAFDLLIDSLPWSFKIIRFPWMEKCIEVKWR